MILAVVYGIRGVINGDALVSVRMIWIRNDALASDGKRALSLHDVVVFSNELAGGVIGNSVGYRAFADVGNRARCTNIGYLIGKEEVCTNSYLRLGKRSAVVHLGGSLRRYRNPTGNNVQLRFAHYRIGEVSAGNADLHLLTIANVNGRDSRRILRPALAINAVFDYQRTIVACLCIGSRQLVCGAIVKMTQACRVERYLVSDARTRRDVQLALGLRNAVVIAVKAVTRGVHDGVVYRAFGNIGYRARCLNLGYLSISKAVASNGHLGTRKRRAVVRLAVGCRRKRNDALGDGDGFFARHIAGVVLAGNTNLNLGVLSALPIPGVVYVLRGDVGRVGGPILAIGAVLDGKLAAILIFCLGDAGAMILAIVGCRNISRGKRYIVTDIVASLNLKRSLFLGNFVVRSLVVGTVRPSDGVGLFVANVLYRAGCRNVGNLAGYKAFVTRLLPTRNVGQREGFARVGPGMPLGLKRYLALSNIQLTVFNLEGYLDKVLAGVLELTSIKAHGVAAILEISALDYRRAAEREVAWLVQTIRRLEIISFNRLLRTAVYAAALVALDGYRNFILNRGNGKRAFLRRDGEVVGGAAFVPVVGNCVLLHIAHIGYRTGSSKAIGLSVEHIIVAGSVRPCLSLAVISEVVAFGFHRYRTLADYQRTIINHKLNVGEVLAGVLELTSSKAHGVAAILEVGVLHFCGAAEREVLVVVQATAVNRSRIAGSALFLTVISFRLRCALNGYRNFIGNRGYFKGARLGFDGVVGNKRAFVQRIGEVVVAGAHVRLGARYAVGGAFAVGKTIAGSRYRAVSKGSAVVNLLIGTRGQRYLALVDLERARLGVHLEFAGYVVTRSILHYRSACDGYGVLTNILHIAARRLKTGNGIGVAIHREGSALQAGKRLVLAVVGRFVGVGLYRNFILGITIGNGKRAFRLGDVVVLSQRAVVQRVVEGVIAGANQGLAARNVISSALAFNKALAANRYLVIGKRRAVVRLAVRSRGERYRTRANDELAIFNLELNVLEIAVLVLEHRRSKAHVIGIRIGTLRHIGVTARINEVLFAIKAGSLAIYLDALYVIAAQRFGSTVVRFVAALSGDNNRNGICHRGNLERARLGFNVVVAGLCVALQRVAEGVVRLANLGSRTGIGIVSTLAIGKAVARGRYFFLSKRSTVVDLFVRTRGQRHIALCDIKMAVFYFKLHIFEVLGSLARKLEAFRIQSHVIRVGIGALCGSGNARLKRNIACGKSAVADGFNVVAGYGLLRTVIFLGIGVALDRDNNLVLNGVDYQLTVGSVSNDVLAGAVNGALGALGELSRIGVCIGTLCANRNAREVGIARCAGKAGNGLFHTVICFGVGISRQRHILVVVDVDLVRIFGKRNGGILARHQRIAAYARLISRYRFAIRSAGNRLGILNLVCGAVHIVVNGIVDGLLRVIEGDFVTVGANLQRFLSSIDVVALNVQSIFRYLRAILTTMLNRSMKFLASILFYILNGIGERALGVVQVYVLHLALFRSESGVGRVEGVALEIALRAGRIEFLIDLNGKLLRRQLLAGSLIYMVDVDIGHRIEVDFTVKMPCIGRCFGVVGGAISTVDVGVPRNVIEVDTAIGVETLDLRKRCKGFLLVSGISLTLPVRCLNVGHPYLAKRKPAIFVDGKAQLLCLSPSLGRRR